MAKVGLVLSGGMAKGAYQIGVLHALEKYLDFQDITVISAASIGALNAYAYATQNLKSAKSMWEQVADRENSKYVASILNSSFLKESIDILAQSKNIDVSKFYLPLYNLRNNTLCYVDLKKTNQKVRTDYLRAAVAMPFFNKAVKIQQNIYYDGAMIDNIPIKPLYEEPLDYIICVYFDNCNYIFEDKYLDQRVIKIVFYNSKRLSDSLCVNRETIDLMVQEGYDKTSRLLDYILASGKDNLEVIYQRKKKAEQYFLSQQNRVTGDVVVNNLNRIAQKFVRKSKVEHMIEMENL